MAITLSIGYTTKKINSCKPCYTERHTANITLKQPTTLTHPTFILNKNENDNIKEVKWDKINYCFFGTYNRYYWIDEVTFITNDLVEISCHVDVLSSFATEIMDQEVFVKYCGNFKKANLFLDDERLCPEMDVPCRNSSIDEGGMWNKLC